jgi:hypothetical protein
MEKWNDGILGLCAASNSGYAFLPFFHSSMQMK